MVFGERRREYLRLFLLLAWFAVSVTPYVLCVFFGYGFLCFILMLLCLVRLGDPSGRLCYSPGYPSIGNGFIWLLCPAGPFSHLRHGRPLLTVSSRSSGIII